MRYKIVEGSESGHCCFEFSVIDTNQNDGIWYKNIAEVFERNDAIDICEALNLRFTGSCGVEYISSSKIEEN
jgi:hypothetical protein